MHKASTALLLAMVISSLSLWGCSNQKNGASNVKIRELESRHAKLEEDYRVILAANESNRRKIMQLDSQRAELTQRIEEMQLVVKERDDLKANLAQRTDERDRVQGELLQFSKDLQNLATRVQVAANRPRDGSIIVLPASRKSQ